MISNLRNLPPRFQFLFIAIGVVLVVAVVRFLHENDHFTQPMWPSSASKPSADTKAVTTPGSAASKGDTNLPPLEKGDLLMLTASSGTGGFLGIPGLKEQVYENRMSYANKWGYDHMWANITSYDFGARIYWNKIPIIQDAFRRYPKAKWVWWLDIDIIIMNHSLDMYTHLLSREGMMRNLEFDKVINKVGGGPSGFKTPAKLDPEDVNFLIASGGWGMNVGSFLMRRSEWTDWTLESWADPLAIKQNWVLPENDGWTHMWRNRPLVQKHAGCTNQRALNAYPSYNKLGAHYQPGDILVHFAGCGNSTACPGHWEKYWNMKDEYEVPDFVKKQLKDGTAHIEDVQREPETQMPLPYHD